MLQQQSSSRDRSSSSSATRCCSAPTLSSNVDPVATSFPLTTELCLLRLALPPKFARVVAGSNLRLEVGGMVFSCERHPSTRIRLSAGRFRLSVLLKSTEKGLSYPNFCLRSTAICRAPTLSTCDSLVHLSSLCPQLTENFHHLLEPWRINLELSSYYQAHLPMAVKNRTKMQIIPECIAVFPVIFNGATILQLQRNRL